MPEIRTTVDPRSGPNISMGVEVPLEATSGQAYPDLPPEAPFLLYWEPGNGCYCVRRLSDGTPVLVPTIKYIRGRPGIGAVAGDGENGSIDFSREVSRIRRRNGVVLDAPTMRAAKLPSYLRKHQTSHKDGKGNDTFHHLPYWRYPRRDRAGVWTIETDEDAKTRWEEGLLANGVIAKPEDEDLRNMVETRQRRIDRHANKATEKDRIAWELEAGDRDMEREALNRAGLVVDEMSPRTTYAVPTEAELPGVKDLPDA